MSVEVGENTFDFESKIARLRGRILTAITTRAHTVDRTAQPAKDYVPSRIGAMPPAPLVSLRNDADACLLAACGVSAALFLANSDGTAQRESYRRFLFSTIQPLGKHGGDRVAVEA